MRNFDIKMWPMATMSAMTRIRHFKASRGIPAVIVALVILLHADAPAQTSTRPEAASRAGQSEASTEAEARDELRKGTALTRSGALEEAIPHLLAAQRAGADPYATGVNLGICYLGTGKYKEAIAVLAPLDSPSPRTATVDNLLAQALLGDREPRAAYAAFLRAAAATPKDETVYAYMADACTDHQNYAMGLDVVAQGLKQLPDSARLHYEHGVFLGRLGRFEQGKPEFERAAQLAPGSYIGYLALVQKDLYDDDLTGATQLLHQAIEAGNRDYRMLSLLGTVLLHIGAAPGEPQFVEAQNALEESAKERPDFSATQIALGKVYLMLGEYQEAVLHLEKGRNLEPDNPAVYPGLAEAYERLGNREKAREMRASLGRLLAVKKSGGNQFLP